MTLWLKRLMCEAVQQPVGQMVSGVGFMRSACWTRAKCQLRTARDCKCPQFTARASVRRTDKPDRTFFEPGPHLFWPGPIASGQKFRVHKSKRIRAHAFESDIQKKSFIISTSCVHLPSWVDWLDPTAYAWYAGPWEADTTLYWAKSRA